MNTLIGNYKVLQSLGYEVVSVTSDMDKETSEKSRARFPWSNKFCDYKGTIGVNFTTFGVIGTPTIFVIDEKGIITGRFAQITEAHILN